VTLPSFLTSGLLAATASSDALDLRTGAVGALTGKTLGIAHGLLAFLFVLALVLELLRGPGQRRRYLLVTWRALLVLALLRAYGFLAGSVVQQCTALSRALATEESVEQLFDKYRAAVAESFGTASGEPASAGSPSASSTEKPGGIGGVLFDALLALLLLIGQAIQWVFTQLARILITFFYAIGPLAIVFYVPGLDAPVRWFRSLVTVSCWPVVSAVLLNLSSSLLTHTRLPTSGVGAVFGAVASSLLLCALAFATPKIASALVGGVGNLVSDGASAATAVVTGAVGGGALGGVARAAAAAMGIGSRMAASATGAGGSSRGSFTPAQPGQSNGQSGPRSGHARSR